MKTNLAFLFLIFVNGAYGTTVAWKDLTNLVSEADHVLIGKIVRVSMVDWDGEEIVDIEARTGPGTTNEIRFHIEVEEGGVLKSSSSETLTELTIPLMKSRHYSLGQLKELEGSTWIFLLKGSRYERVYPGLFKRSLDEKEEIQQLLRNEKTQNKGAP